MTFRKITRTQQPQTPVGVDWSNPITQGLLSAILPGVNEYDAVTYTTYKSQGIKKGYKGGLGSYSGNGGILTKSFPVLNIDATIFWFGVLDSNTGTGQLLTNRWSYSGTGIPIGLCSYTSPSRVGFNIVGISNSILINTDLSLGNSINFTAIRKGTLAAIFRNGDSIGTGVFNTQAVVNNPAYPLTFGSLSDATNSEKLNGSHFLGCVWNRALSTQEIKSLSDNPWQIFQPIEMPIYTNNSLPNLPSTASPVKDLSKGLWQGFSPNNVNQDLSDKLDESSLDLGDYIQTEYPSTAEFELSEAKFPGTGSHTLKYTASSTQGSQITVKMRQGMTEIAQWTHPLTPTDTTYTQTLTPEQIAKIVAGPIIVNLDIN